jgi:hypothetical protein
MTDPTSLAVTETVTTPATTAPVSQTPTVHSSLTEHIKVLNDYLNAEAARHEELKNIVKTLQDNVGVVHTRLNTVGATLPQYTNMASKEASYLETLATNLENKLASEIKVAKRSGIKSAISDFWQNTNTKAKIIYAVVLLAVIYTVIHFI